MQRPVLRLVTEDTQDVNSISQFIEDRIDSCMISWEQTFGPSFPYMRYDCRSWIEKDGISFHVIIAAIIATTSASRPSWNYVRAIIRNLKAEGVKTWSQWEARQRAFRAGFQ